MSGLTIEKAILGVIALNQTVFFVSSQIFHVVHFYNNTKKISHMGLKYPIERLAKRNLIV